MFSINFILINLLNCSKFLQKFSVKKLLVNILSFSFNVVYVFSETIYLRSPSEKRKNCCFWNIFYQLYLGLPSLISDLDLELPSPKSDLDLELPILRTDLDLDLPSLHPDLDLNWQV